MIDDLAWLLGELFVKSSALLVLAFTVAAGLKRRSAEERHLLWVVVTGALLLLPVLSATLPPVDVPVSLSIRSAAPVSLGDLGTAPPAATAPNTLPSGLRGPMTMPGRASSSLEPSLVIGLTYIIIAALLLVSLGIESLRVGRLTRRLPEITDTGVLALVDAVCREQGIRRRVRVRLSDAHRTPWVWGWLRPNLIVPLGFVAWADEDRRNAIVHEIAHVARCDLPTSMAARICCALYWFQPLAWLAVRGLAREAENACDDRVLRRGASRAGYAGQLVALAREIYDTAASSPAVSMAAGSAMKRRIESILDPRTRRNNVNTTKIALAVVAALCVVGPLAGLRSQEAGVEQPAAALDDDTLRRIAAAGPRDSTELETLVTAYLDDGGEAQAVRVTADYLMRPAEGGAFDCGYCESLLKTEGLVPQPALRAVLLPAFDEVERRAYRSRSGELFLRLAEISLGSRNRTAVARGSRYLLEAFRLGGPSDEAKQLRVRYLVEMQEYEAAKSLAETLREDPNSSWHQSDIAEHWIDYSDGALRRSDALSGRLVAADAAASPGDEDYLPLVKVAPDYPRPALEAGTEGYAVVQFTVTELGRTADIVVVESTDSVFHQSSIDAAEQFVYMPKIIDGVPAAITGVRNKITYVIE